ncbi:tetratricopeptide repeat protein [Streptococcus cuniculi]|uniref:Tetratricopeptide repeat protein n=1 Tax=Streptococcus cuniculi TaxID=1432788 RepID=A0A4Y9JCN4_9STRE|nr:tetratricopeptide repeat protein [Streptococcus cuniculi]MBF0777171.1 tetratricopeptide repeat protein [Streptococcus cuniculi]TFU98780.1 tetratricopeptide repeat protein [Streptococcus cuniculi]
MFSFFKKKKFQKKEEIPQDSLSADEKVLLRGKILDLNKQLEQEGLAVAQQARLYEEVGLLQAKLGETNVAIETLEKSLDLKLTIGDGYKQLMSLYNLKRAEAARDKDNEAIDYYMSKMDDMRNIAKKLTLTR